MSRAAFALLAAPISQWRRSVVTRASVAACLNKPQSFVAKYENGERRIDVIEFVDIASVLGVATADLLARIEPVTSQLRPSGE
ncbi:helix-turn-helix domain-containing protein [Rhodopseudomonas sp. HC1]|uniref:helix-turn-helix domain-containing protein n=1 Tax=Rhodopseudomonas infernalis TaxID=2897386 RepID=UPI001EE827DB|nr:helix-turn-helix transcriptional regulator [Rhodopseudomonas infernalis]MCG6207471.1 helix-turn-helix domain-containing protein [Rhodopseudomonas infernalis]